MHTLAFACIVVGAALSGYMVKMIAVDRRLRAKVVMLRRAVESPDRVSSRRKDRAA